MAPYVLSTGTFIRLHNIFSYAAFPANERYVLAEVLNVSYVLSPEG
jgi:hypothetical protein